MTKSMITATNEGTDTAIPSNPTTTDVEAWLLELGLRAIQVERCPHAECEACRPVDERLAA